eukprot:4293590-Pleurochrysis_carterae.AAC.1
MGSYRSYPSLLKQSTLLQRNLMLDACYICQVVYVCPMSTGRYTKPIGSCKRLTRVHERLTRTISEGI